LSVLSNQATCQPQSDFNTQQGENPMNTQFPNQSASLSMMISRTAYRAVVGIESIARLSTKKFWAGK
tara:strand:- start:166 stop:366 length:201 start_codon:yes stop_codon:yes gene_type:complete